MQQKNYYIILSIKNSASSDEIKAAYRELAKKYHPDKNQGNKAAEEFFKEIQEAYTVLSNEEKRKKYDLRFSYGSSYSQQKQTNQRAQYTQYTGNAYQYAQQQAQQKQYFDTQQKTRPQKSDKTESYQILISVGIALILLYFIISYTTNDTTRSKTKETVAVETSVNRTKEPQPTINNFDSPYSNFFGEEVYDNESKNCITIHNSDESEVVVCLVENKVPYKTIRNKYMIKGAIFKLNYIPNGEYFLNAYYGTNWDTIKIFLNNKIKGGFKNEIGFASINTGSNVFKMKQQQAGAGTSFSSYEIGVQASAKEKVKVITAEEFFK
jgi:curved DNA-binding protein CbpA